MRASSSCSGLLHGFQVPGIPGGCSYQWRLSQRQHWIPWLSLCALSASPPLPFSSKSKFCVIFLLLLIHLYKSFLLPCTSLTICNGVGFNFANTISPCFACSIFLLDHVTLLLQLLCCFSTILVRNSFFIHVGHVMTLLDSYFNDGLLFNLEKEIFEWQSALLSLSSRQGHIPWYSSKQVLNMLKDAELRSTI